MRGLLLWAVVTALATLLNTVNASTTIPPTDTTAATGTNPPDASPDAGSTPDGGGNPNPSDPSRTEGNPGEAMTKTTDGKETGTGGQQTDGHGPTTGIPDNGASAVCAQCALWSLLSGTLMVSTCNVAGHGQGTGAP